MKLILLFEFEGGEGRYSFQNSCLDVQKYLSHTAVYTSLPLPSFSSVQITYTEQILFNEPICMPVCGPYLTSR